MARELRLLAVASSFGPRFKNMTLKRVSQCLPLLVFWVAMCASVASASDCQLDWVRRPKILPEGLRLACDLSADRHLFTINRSGRERILKRRRAVKLGKDRLSVEDLRSRFRRLRRFCLQYNPLTLEVPQFRVRYTCSHSPAAPEGPHYPVVPEGPAIVGVSRASAELGTIGIEEHQLSSVILKPLQGTARIERIEIAGDERVELLPAEEVLGNGGVPCEGDLGAFCSIFIRVHAVAPGLVNAQISVIYKDVLDESAQSNHIVIPVHAEVSAQPFKALNSFTTVNIEALAAARNETPLTMLRNEFAALQPAWWNEADVGLFDSYNSVGTSDWANNWANSALDLSGVAWDVSTGGTAITRCHIVFAAHYLRNDDKPIKFHRKDGRMFRSIVSRVKRTEGADIAVGLLDPCLPADWTVYPLAEIGDHQTVIGAPLIMTHNPLATSFRRISIHSLSSYMGAGRDMLLTNRHALLPSFLFQSGVLGDSGHPGFYLVNGRLAVAMTFTSSNAGPAYSAAINHQRIAQAIAALPPGS